MSDSTKSSLSDVSKRIVTCSAAIVGSYVLYSWLRTASFNKQQPIMPKIENKKNECKYIYVAGDRSSVGKSSICVAIIQTLIDNKILLPSEIGYIKPQTQCISATNVSRYCLTNNIDCIPIGPIIFRKGYTSQVIDHKHNTKEYRFSLINNEIKKLSLNKKLVIIDGVGYISVGSVSYIDNIDCAKYFNAYSILVIRSGIGDAIDTSNLLLSYYKSKNYDFDKFLGIIYNFKEKNRTHSIKNCKKYVSKYYDNINNNNEYKPFDNFPKNIKILGWIPPINKDNVNVPEQVSGCIINKNTSKDIDFLSWPNLNDSEIKWLIEFAKHFQNNVDFDYILNKLQFN